MRIAIALLISALAAGCEPVANPFRRPPTAPANLADQPAPAPLDTAKPGAAGATKPATAAPRPGRQPVMATVNGEPIYMNQLIQPLLEAHGVPLAELLIANKLVAQAAAGSNITVTEKDVTAENDRTLRGLFGDELTEDQRDRMLTELLRQRGLTRKMWRLTMWRNAAIRKMIAPQIKITEPMLRAEFIRQYGQKVQISHIQLPNATEAEKIIKLLKGEHDFAKLAKRYSTNTTTAAKGGLLPPFARDDSRVPKAMRETAFSLKVGQTSGIVQTENDFHVLKLHKRITPAQVKYDAVKEELRAALHDRLVEHMQREIISRLKRTAAVEYVNPTLQKVLREQYKQTPPP